jgi:hypothetical protein
MKFKHVLTVIRREIKVAMGKSFILATIFIPLVMFGIVGIQALVSDIKTEAPSPVIVLLQPDAPFEQALRDEIGKSEELSKSKISATFEKTTTTAEAFLDTKRDELLANDNMGIVFVPNSAATDKKVVFY